MNCTSQELDDFLNKIDKKLVSSCEVDDFLSKIERKLDSVLFVNKRLIDENIKLRNMLPATTTNCPETVQNAQIHECTPSCTSTTDFSSQKKIIMIEQIKNSDELSFSGKGTYDAKEIIKTFGFSRFDSGTKNWIVKPDKTLNFIKENLERDYDVQFLD